jgi:phosphoribosylamine-glycine ligase
MGERQLAQRECIDALDTAMLHAKFHLGYPSNGSMGIGHPHVHVTAKRAYEVEKVLDKVLSEHKDPSPKFRGVNYDGLIVRYTNDPEPTASVE